MGDGEFIPNGSMHWSIREQEVTEPSPGNITRGPVNSNLRGRDPINFDHIGKGKGGESHPEDLLVTLRFTGRGEAEKAIGDALAAGRDVNGMYEVRVRLRAIRRSRGQAEQPSPNQWAQVRVEW
jgi:hypothetical protein